MSNINSSLLGVPDMIEITFDRPIFVTFYTLSVPSPGEQRLNLIRASGGAKDFRVAGEFARDILRAFRPSDSPGKCPTVLPAL
ncbi:hypothetical protein BJY52DRAFT_1195428 [Lactarius psammicola]|nr:hypothetical protein BJY52DRAFT_1195428 [Lactarius psammicola]